MPDFKGYKQAFEREARSLTKVLKESQDIIPKEMPKEQDQRDQIRQKLMPIRTAAEAKLSDLKLRFTAADELIQQQGDNAHQDDKKQLEALYDKLDEFIVPVNQIGSAIEMIDRLDQREERAAQYHDARQFLPEDGNQSGGPTPAAPDKFKLRKLELIRFSGNQFQWKPFWDVFESCVHSAASLQPVDKMSYLLSVLDGEPLHLISSLSRTNDNYGIAVSLLKEHYDNPKALLTNIHSQMINIRPPSNETRKLREFYVTIESALQRLESLGKIIDDDHWVTLIFAKLPRAIQFNLERSKASDDWTVKTLKSALLREIQVREHVESVGGKEHTTTEVRGHSDNRGHREQVHGAKTTTSDTMAASESAAKRRFRCAFCDGEHYPDECKRFKTVSDRKERLKEQRRCFRCFKPGHAVKECRNTARPCYYCKSSDHNQALCTERFGGREDKRQIQRKPAASRVDNRPTSARTSTDAHTSSDQNNPSCSATDEQRKPESEFLAVGENGVLQTAMLDVENPKSDQRVSIRAFFDNGSTRSYISGKRAKELQLKLEPSQELRVNRFMGGGSPMKVKTNLSYIHVIRYGKPFRMAVSVIDNMADCITRVPIDPKIIQRRCQNLKLADTLPSKYETRPIELLVGMDYYMDLTTAERIQIQEGLYLTGSPFGWILGGRVTETMNPASETGYFVQATTADPLLSVSVEPRKGQKNYLSDLWDLETIGIRDSPYVKDDDYVVEQFERTVKFQDGRYHVKWPLKQVACQLPTNYGLAMGRFKNLLRRLQGRPDLYKKVSDIFRDQLEKRIIEKVDESDARQDGQLVHYISHHPVETPQKTTTKVRQVFDASAKQGLNLSLNDSMYRGPVILENLCGLLLRFRLHPIAIVSDIEKAFLQVGLQEEDRDLTRFFWLKDDSNINPTENVQVMRFRSVAFGMKASPFLLGMVVQHHLKQYSNDVAERIRENTYVDNVITGVETIEGAHEFYDQAKRMFSEAGMNLREWRSNSQELMRSVKDQDRSKDLVIKVLGVEWDSIKDELHFKLSSSAMMNANTTREMLAAICKDFDPLGYLCPVTIRLRILLQRSASKNWDTPLSAPTREAWHAACSDLSEAHVVRIPRFIGRPLNHGAVICCFVDASPQAYATAVYLKLSGDDGKACLIFAKNRLCPKREVSIPRLELMAAVIGARAVKFVREQLRLKDQLPAIIWSDSQCVLSWLRSKRDLTVFVENRVREIKATPDTTFCYVNTCDNPADFATRGKSPSELSESMWWSGPSWLHLPRKDWPIYKEPMVTSDLEASVSAGIKRQAIDASHISTDVKNKPPFGIDISRFRTATKLWRVTAYVQRAISRFKRADKADIKNGPIDSTEFYAAKQRWDKYVQDQSLPDALKAKSGRQKTPSVVQQLNLQVDDNGIIRCHSRFKHAAITDDAKYPVLLPKDSPYTRLVIKECHERCLHSGPAHTLAELRSSYWVPSGRVVVKSVIRECRGCRRYTAAPYRLPRMPDLPEARVNRDRPFRHIGLDYFGPFLVKLSREDKEPTKAWVCIYTCFVVRAVHAEVVLDMTAESFIAAMRRFIAKRGKPDTIICDNAPSFKLGSAVIGMALQEFASSETITWRFIPEYAPWAGGVYERMVGILKHSLVKGIGRSRLSFDQFQTILAEAVAVSNSRPLTYVEDDLTTILTPNCFLGVPRITIFGNLSYDPHDPDYTPDVRSQRNQMLAVWKKGQSILNQFWKIWESQYLLSLRERTRWFHKDVKGSKDDTPQIGEVVLIYDHLRSRNDWLMGRVTETVRSADKAIRSVRLVLPSGRTTVRPVNHLYTLEVPTEPDQSKPEKEASLGNKSQSATPMIRPQRIAAAKAKELLHRQLKDESDEDGC